MENNELLKELRQLSVQTGSLACLGCGREHGCSVHGCAILKKAAEALEEAEGVVRSTGRLAKHYRDQRDAAVRQLRRIGDCDTCKKNQPLGYDPPECVACTRGQAWEWDGGSHEKN